MKTNQTQSDIALNLMDNDKPYLTQLDYEHETD